MSKTLKALLASCQRLSISRPSQPSVACLLNNVSSFEPLVLDSQVRFASKKAAAPNKNPAPKPFPVQLEQLERFTKKSGPPKTDYSEEIKEAIATASDEEGLAKLLNHFFNNHSSQTWLGKHDYANASYASDFVKACVRLGAWTPLVTLWQSAYRYGVDPTAALLRESVAAPAAVNDGCSAALVLFYGSCYISAVPKDAVAAVRTALDAQEKALSAEEGEAAKGALEKIAKYREALDRLRL